jgi:protein arginine N-methyltransferase 1
MSAAERQPASDADLARPHTGAPADIIPLQYHVQMLQDEHRMTSFIDAIAAVVRPGMHVLELGAGTGVMSFFAAQQGARVTAIEREPGVYNAAQKALAGSVGDAVTLVHADARDFLPDTPVDVVICEMMHVGQLREKQIEVIASFKERYLERFGGPLPRFLPEACVQAVQPVEQDFTFFGYTMPAPLFQSAFHDQPRTRPMADPQLFSQFFYSDEIPTEMSADLNFTAESAGTINAIRIVTKNLLVAGWGREQVPAGVDWLMGYLIVPLAKPVFAAAGQRVNLSFQYAAGDEITTLMAAARGTTLADPSQGSMPMSPAALAARAAGGAGMAARATVGQVPAQAQAPRRTA